MSLKIEFQMNSGTFLYILLLKIKFMSFRLRMRLDYFCKFVKIRVFVGI